jgi:hypothetical protein
VEETTDLVLLGEAAGSARERPAATAWLRDLAAELDEAYGEACLAPFELTDEGRIVGRLAPGADPMVGLLRAGLSPGWRPLRWVCVWGRPPAGGGSAAKEAGDAVDRAREAMAAAAIARDRLVLLTGDPAVDELLADMAPAMVDLLEGLTKHQRVVARMALIEGLRQAGVAQRLDIRRATVSIAFVRARVHSIGRLAEAIRKTCGASSASPPDAGVGSIRISR